MVSAWIICGTLTFLALIEHLREKHGGYRKMRQDWTEILKEPLPEFNKHPNCSWAFFLLIAYFMVVWMWPLFALVWLFSGLFF